MQPYLLFLLLLAFIPARTQTLTVTIDASQRRTKDTLLVGDHQLPIRPGKTTTGTFPFQGPSELILDKLAILGANDSVHITYDGKQQQYVIDGGRYPDNYRAFGDLFETASLPDIITQRMDYDAYVRGADTTIGNRLARLQQEKSIGSLSPDVADYLTGYLKYKELEGLIAFQSRNHLGFLPATHSRLYPMATLEDFRQDRYANDEFYINCATLYLQTRFTSSDPDSTATQAISFAIDSLSGYTRAKVLHTLIVGHDYKPKHNMAAFTSLYNRIRKLHLAASYTAGIDLQYKKAMREHHPLSATLLNQPLLRTPTGEPVSLRSILDTLKDQDVFIKFTEFGSDVMVGGSSNIIPVVADPRIITIDLYSSLRDWRQATKDRLLTNEYYLPNGLKNPLATALLISTYPTWVALSRDGKIDDIDISLDDIFRYNLLGQ